MPAVTAPFALVDFLRMRPALNRRVVRLRDHVAIPRLGLFLRLYRWACSCSDELGDSIPSRGETLTVQISPRGTRYMLAASRRQWQSVELRPTPFARGRALSRQWR